MSTTSNLDNENPMAGHLNTTVVSEIAETMDIDNANLSETMPAFDNETEPMAAAQEPSSPAEINMDDASGHGSGLSNTAQVSSQSFPPRPLKDPLGFYGEALENNLRRPPISGKRNTYGGRTYDDNLREQSNEIGYGCGRQVTRFEGHEHQRARRSYGYGYQGGDGYYQGLGVYSPTRSGGPVRGQGGSRSARHPTFDDGTQGGRAQPSRASDYGEGEVVDDEQSPQAEMTTAPPNGNGDGAIEPTLSTSGTGSLDKSNLRPQTVDENDEDGNDLFVPQAKPAVSRGGPGGNRGRGSTRGRGRGRNIIAAPSLRNGKPPFSTRHWGMLEDGEDEEPARPAKRKAIQAENGRPVQTSSRQHMPEGWQNYPPPNHQGPSMASSSYPQSYGYPKSREYDEDEEEGTGHELNRPYEYNRRSGPANRPVFNQPSSELHPSRYSGVINTYNVNQDPPMVEQNEVSDAYLKKRGLERGKKEKVCKRGYGANDPENIRIVNMHESEGKTMAEIAHILNADRVAKGRKPTLTKLSCSARYARTAPLLFAAQGEVFVPLSERRKPGWEKPGPKIVWTEKLDETLVDCVQTWEQRKWTDVADLFNDATGHNVDKDIVSIRYSML